MADWMVREATESDIPVIRALAHRIWPVAYREMISLEQLDYMLEWMYSLQALTQQMREDGCVFFILSDGNLEHGFASVSTKDHTAKLNKLYVLVEHHGKGAGSALLNAAIEYARSKGCSEIELQVNKKNPAQHFYHRHDFSIREEAVFDIGQGFVMDDYIMRRPL
ncbi:MAG: GNAT family N-acetyltransferase [Flavobacteriales bacterium]